MALELTLQMNEITEALIKGEISQEEALAKQRALLGQEIPKSPESPENLEILQAQSTETKAAAAIAKYQAIKADIAAQLVQVKERAAIAAEEKVRLSGAINAAESKQRILAGSPGTYKQEKADLIAKGLLGEKVDLDQIKTPAADFSDNISAGDLALGIKALRSQLQDMERRIMGFTADKRRLAHEYCEAHAMQHGIEFMLLANELITQYCNIQAAHRVSQQAGNTFSTLAPESLSSLAIFNPLPFELMQQTGLGRREISGRVIEESHAVRNAMVNLHNEMGV